MQDVAIHVRPAPAHHPHKCRTSATHARTQRPFTRRQHARHTACYALAAQWDESHGHGTCWDKSPGRVSVAAVPLCATNAAMATACSLSAVRHRHTGYSHGHTGYSHGYTSYRHAISSSHTPPHTAAHRHTPPHTTAHHSRPGWLRGAWVGHSLGSTDPWAHCPSAAARAGSTRPQARRRCPGHKAHRGRRC